MFRKRKFIKIRLYLALVGLIVFYTVVHEFAYRRYKLSPGSVLKNTEKNYLKTDTLDTGKKTE